MELLQGYACTWWSHRSDRNETFARGAFGRWLAESGQSIKLIFDHIDPLLLARRRDGTLAVWEDDYGLAFEADIQTWGVGSFASDIGNGTMGCSIGWRTIKSHQGTMAPLNAGLSMDQLVAAGRGTVIEQAALFEISLTREPAYESTGCWMSNADEYAVHPHVAALRERWRAGRDKPLTAPAEKIVALPTSRTRSPAFAAAVADDPLMAAGWSRSDAQFIRRQGDAWRALKNSLGGPPRKRGR